MERWKRSDAKKNTTLLGVAFLVFLGLVYAENLLFFSFLDDVLQNQFLVVGMLFLHNLLVVSLILLGMKFCVNLVVLNFLKQEKHADVTTTHPRSYVTVLACMIIFLSILRGAALTNGGVALETLPLILLISSPVGIVEGYGIYLTIKKTLDRTMSMSGLSYIYGCFSPRQLWKLSS